MGVGLLPFLQIDIAVLVPLIFFDLSVPGPVRLLGVRPIRLLAGVIERRFAGILVVWRFAHGHITSPFALFGAWQERAPEVVVPVSADQAAPPQAGRLPA